MEEQANKNFELMPVILFATLFPVVIGLLLRIPKLIIEIKQNKPWTFDWIKFIAIGLPCFYFVAMPILSFSSLGGGIIKTPSIVITGSPLIRTVTGVVFGYILLDSFKQKE